MTADLNQIFRRLRHYQNEEQWISALRDGLSLFAGAFAIFVQQDSSLFVMRAQHNLPVEAALQIRISSARAFAAAIESRDSIVTLRTPAEVGPALAADPSAFGGAPRAHVVPILNGDRVVSVIFVPAEEFLDISGVELIAGLASAVLERRSNQAIHQRIELVPPQSAPQSGSTKKSVSTDPMDHSLSESERLLHSRARRFARVAVADMQLNRPEACRAGREQNDLYMFLRQEIDKARESYGQKFMADPQMMDYLHLELTQTVADGDERKLGADYPGALV
jgi:hypothetical protein